jgi:hypothetical protein
MAAARPSNRAGTEAALRSVQEVTMHRFAGSWKAFVALVVGGAMLFLASMSVDPTNLFAAAASAAATEAGIAAPAADPSAEPPSNEIQDFPQLD